MGAVTRKLTGPPSILPLYARAAAPLIPGASLLPFIPGGGGEIPELELTLDAVRADPERVAAYARVCGFALRDHLPPTYPHVLAFPLHMAVMADGSFPFGAVGLVHVRNRIAQRRRIGLGEELRLSVRPTALAPHPRGQVFSLLTEARVGEEQVWESTSTMLRRGTGATPTASVDVTAPPDPSIDVAVSPDPSIDVAVSPGRREETRPQEVASGEWSLGGDLGRRYAAVSGDRNPIHMHAWTAKPFGFPSAIAHGMWTKARCLAAIENRLPDAFGVDVDFRKPIFLPGRVEFLCSAPGKEIAFAVRDAKRQTPHLDGLAKPLEADSESGRKR